MVVSGITVAGRCGVSDDATGWYPASGPKLTAAFRGRQLDGCTVDVPSGFIGVWCLRAGAALSADEVVTVCVCVQACW
jgi:hypothetical protein